MLVREWLPGRKQKSVSNIRSTMALRVRSLALSVLFLTFSYVSYGQGTGGTNTPPSGSTPPASSPSSSAPSTGPSSSGTFSIEAEIFGYKSLQSDSEAIACDIAGFVYPSDGITGFPYGKNTLVTPKDWTDEEARRYEPRTTVCRFKDDQSPAKSGKGVVILPSTSSAIANYQLWRLDMTIMHLYLQQAASLGCPAPQAAGKVDFVFDPAIVGQVITVVQSALQLFANSESALEVTGTIQDQALVDGIARELRNLKVPVLVPDLYTSFSLTNSDYTESPFLSRLVQLVVQRNCLQNNLQDAQAELKKITDVTAERDSYLKIRSDVLEKEIDPKLTAAGKKVLDDQVTYIQTKLDALNKQLDDLNADGAQTTITAVQSLTSTIDAFVATLLGATPASSTPATASAPPTPSPAPAGAPASNPASSPAAPPTSATTGSPTSTATPAPSGSVPPIISALAGDGLSRRLFPKKDDKYTLQDTDWRVLSVKALESGGALITTTNIFGSKVHFSGGAVATYALFSLRGDLECSGNVFDYGGYLRPSQFTKKFRRPDLEPDKQLLFLRGGCAPAQPESPANGPK